MGPRRLHRRSEAAFVAVRARVSRGPGTARQGARRRSGHVADVVTYAGGVTSRAARLGPFARDSGTRPVAAGLRGSALGSGPRGGELQGGLGSRSRRRWSPRALRQRGGPGSTTGRSKEWTTCRAVSRSAGVVRRERGRSLGVRLHATRLRRVGPAHRCSSAGSWPAAPTPAARPR